jgi:hypothetical protein
MSDIKSLIEDPFPGGKFENYHQHFLSYQKIQNPHTTHEDPKH